MRAHEALSKKRCGPVSRISFFKRAPPRRQDQRRFSNISQRPRFSARQAGGLDLQPVSRRPRSVGGVFAFRDDALEVHSLTGVSAARQDREVARELQVLVADHRRRVCQQGLALDERQGRDPAPSSDRRSKHHRQRAGALLPRFIREWKLGIPVSSQATSSQSMMALLTGTRASAGRNDLNRLVMSRRS